VNTWGSLVFTLVVKELRQRSRVNIDSGAMSADLNPGADSQGPEIYGTLSVAGIPCYILGGPFTLHGAQ